MIDKILQIQQPLEPVATGKSRAETTRTDANGRTFQDILSQSVGTAHKVSFSAHAERRLTSRGISMSPSQMDRLGQAVDAVKAKGGKDSLVMLDGLYLIVNVPSRTVVTAMEQGGMSDRVVTNIDSAAIG